MKERAKKALKAAVRATLILAFIEFLAGEIFSWSRIGVYLLAAFAVAYILKGWRDDMPTRAKVLTVVMTIVILFGARFVLHGLFIRSQILADYWVSEDGSIITVNPADGGLPSSVGGGVRSMRTEYSGDSIYCYFYDHFGGNLSSVGSKYSYDIKLEEDSTKIYFQGNRRSRLVLQKDEETNTWVMCDPW